MIKKIIIHNHELTLSSSDCLNCVPTPTAKEPPMNNTNTPTTHDLLLQRLEELEEQARERLGEAKQRAREAHEELESVAAAAAIAYGTDTWPAWKRIRDAIFDRAEATEAAVVAADAAVQAARLRAHALRSSR